MRSIQRVLFAASTAVALLNSCGGDGCPNVCFPDIPPEAISWDSPSYEIVTSPTSLQPVAVSATLYVQGFQFIEGIDKVSISPSGKDVNPTPGDELWPITITDKNNQHGRVDLRFTVVPTVGTDSYPTGTFTFTATLLSLDEAHAQATTTVVVRSQ